MATSDVLTKESEEMFDKCCSHCSESGRISEAKTFCVECGLHFCENCVRFHKTIPVLQSHELVDLQSDETGGENKQNKIELPTERCSIHHGKLMDMFCKDHDEVCCGVCIAIKHRTCVDVDYVPDIAKDVRACQEFTDVEESVTFLLGNLKLEKQKRTSNIVKLEEEKDKLVDTVEQYQNDLIEKIKVIAESTKLEILSDFKDKKRVITADVETLDILIPAMETRLQKLSTTNSAQLLVNIKASKRAVKDEESVLKGLSSSWITKEMRYVFNEIFTCTLSKMKTLGIPEEDVREYEAKLYGKFNTKEDTDTYTPDIDITGLCLLHDGSLIITDYLNKKVKLLNSSYEVKQSIAVNDKPIGICYVGSNEVAVSFHNSCMIQFLSIIDLLRLTTTIQLDKKCYGLNYSESSDELFACCGNRINVYNKAGNLLRVLKIGSNGEPLFSSVRQVYVNHPNSEIVVSDYYKGVIAIDSKGETKWHLKDQELVGTWGLCATPSGIRFTSGSSSNNVLQIGKNGEKIAVLLDVSERLYRPYALAFDRHNSRLLVGMTSDYLHVYSLVPK